MNIIDIRALADRLQRQQSRAYIMGLHSVGDNIGRQLRFVWGVIVRRQRSGA